MRPPPHLHLVRSCWLLAPVFALAVSCFQPLDAYEAPGAEERAGGDPAASPSADGGGASDASQIVPVPPNSTRPPLDASVAPAVPPAPGSPPGMFPPSGQPGFPLPGTPPAWLDAGVADVCQGFAPDRCQQTQGCALLRLYAVDLMNNCSTGETRPLCARQIGCGLFGSTLASDPSGRVFTVPVGCLPSGFQPLALPTLPRGSPCPSAAAQSACARHLDERSCVGDLAFQCIPSSATSYDPVKQCVGGEQAKFHFLSCGAPSTALGGSAYYRDPQGQIWRVPPESLRAVPTGWSPIAPSSVIPDAGAELPVCLIPL